MIVDTGEVKCRSPGSRSTPECLAAYRIEGRAWLIFGYPALSIPEDARLGSGADQFARQCIEEILEQRASNAA